MSYTSEYLQRRKKRQNENNEQGNKGSKSSESYSSYLDEYLGLREERKSEPNEQSSKSYVQNAQKDDDDIAPVAEQKQYLGGLLKKGAFEDGYQFGDIFKAGWASQADLGMSVLEGAGNMVEGLTDLALYGVAGVSDLVGGDSFADDVKEVAKKNSVSDLADNIRDFTGIDEASVWGDTGKNIGQGIGQVGTIILTGGLLGGAGVGASAITAITTGATGLSSMGSGMSEAYNSGATDEEAAAYGAMSGVIDAGTELIFGGLGKAVNALGYSRGLTSLDDAFAKKLSSKISNQFFKNAAEYGVKASAEGLEEVLAGIASAKAKQLTYKSDEELQQLVEDEDLLEQFVVGAVTSGVAQGVDLVNANKQGRDFITGLTANEEAVVQKEYENRVAEAEKGGQKLTDKEKNKIYEQVQEDLKKGFVSTDTIESVLGGDTYKSYQDTVSNEEAILKEYEELGKKEHPTLAEQTRYAELHEMVKDMESNSQRSTLKTKLSEEVQKQLTRQVGKNTQTDDFLIESYNERARRGQAYEADLSGYDDAQAEVIKKAVDSGILNNTRRTHEFVDMIAKLSADKGVSFDFTNNEKLKESGFALDGKTVNGFVTKDGVTLNIQSAKALNTVVGHEISHVLEGTELYTELQKTLFEYAKSKKDYDSRRKAIEDLYEGVADADIDSELTADLVGDYLFTDSDFINNLSTNNRNVFQKIYDEIKYLCKVAKAGSKEARELEKVKRAFEKAYRESGKANADNTATKYALSKDVNGNVFVDVTEDIFDSNNGESVARTIQRVISERFNNQIDVHGQKIQINKTTNDEFRRSNSANDLLENSTQAYNDKLKTIANADEILSAAKNWIGEEIKHIRTDDIVEFARGNVMYRVGKNGYVADVIVGTRKNGAAVLYDLVNIYDTKIAEAPVTMASNENSQRRQDASAGDIVSQKGLDVNRKFSLSSDSEGTKLTKEQSEYFKDTKAVDKNGNLLKVYHTTNRDFTVFDKSKKGETTGDANTYLGFFFSDDAEHMKNFPGFQDGKTEAYYLNMKNPIDMTNISREAFLDIVEVMGGDVQEAAEVYDESLAAEQKRAKLRGDNNTSLHLDNLFIDLTGDYYYEDFFNELKPHYDELMSRGYDGVVNYLDELLGTKEYIVLDSNQAKLTTNLHPTADQDTRHSLSADGEQPKAYGSYNVYGKDIALENQDIAPTQETITATETAESTMPTDFAPMADEPSLDDLRREYEGVLRQFREASRTGNAEMVRRYSERLTELNQAISRFEADESAYQSERMNSLADSDVPPEVEAPYYGESEDIAPIDPFADRDIKDVGNRSVKAYMYENPEVKPFFQKEAETLLGELRDTVKGERYYVNTPDGRPGEYGSDSMGFWTGTSRYTSPDIAYLLDELKISYADIEKDLNAIIEDNGKENNAVSKRIEFLLNDRLMNGYQDISGLDIPANQDYINLLNEKQITEYNEEARKALFETADDFAPVVGTAEEIAPTKEYEAIKPRPEKRSGEEAEWAANKMARADNEDTRRGKRRKFVKSSIESDAVDGNLLQDDLDQTKIFYQPISNKKTLGAANSRLEGMGYEASVAYFNSQFANKKTGLEDIVLGERLIQEAIKRGDTKTAGELIEDVAILGTELGQKVQALSIIKRLTPEGQLRMLQRTVERGKTKGDKAFDGVEITQEMIDKILGVYEKTSDETVHKLQSEIAKLGGTKLTRTDAFYVNGDTYKHRRKLKELGFTWDAENKAWYLPDASGTFDQAKLNEAVEDVKQKLAEQMKVTMSDKANAWRYLSMLGNPKTHIRNLVSNVAMRGTIAVKNVVARSIESIAPIKNRTKTWESASDDVKSFAQTTAAEMKDVLSDGGKYSEEASIKAKRKIFKNKILNGVYEFNSDLLTKEDWWFSKPAFTKSLSEYLTANGIRTKQDIHNNPEIVEKAKQYATEQAQIATFRQYSWLSNKINEIERHNTATKIAVGAALPFKKTPINIAKTALNYSPLGFAKTLASDIPKVKNGDMEASAMIDNLSQNVTGTALTLIGYLLASTGFINGGGEDDKEGEYDYQLGEQAYSVNIGGATFSLSWLSPIAMPLFVGANAYEQLEEGEEWNGDVVVETLAQTLDPLSEMSFLSSLDDVLSSYDSGVEKFAGIGESLAQNYITQFVPTFSSQVATVMDDTKRSTKVAGDSGFKFVDETINKLKYKIPFLRETLEPMTDIWGNEVKQTDNMMKRAVETFLAPYSKKDNIATEVDAELKELYGETGDDGIIPNIPNNHINYDGEKYEMSAAEYTEYKKTYGQTASNLLEMLFETTTYQNADSEIRAEMVNKVYDYAREKAKKQYFTKNGVAYTNATKDGTEYYKEGAIKGAIENDMTVEEYEFSTKNPEKYAVAKSIGGYDAYKTYSSELYDIKADKDESGKSISGSRKNKVIDYINNLNADYGEKIILFKSQYPADDTYNREIVEYLNSRDDISYEEMAAILKELGFTVHSDGTVTW